MSLPKISVIIPVYNVEKYLSKCIDSVLVQSFSDFELLLIDDGSTDNSGRICDEYAQKDKRIRVFHKKNGGVSSARNIGLENARGEWIYFSDADDLLYGDSLETLLSKTSIAIDSVVGGFTRYGNAIIEKTILDIEVVWNYKQALKDFYNPKYQYNNWYLWNRLFRHSVIKTNRLRFHEDIYFKEDGLFIVQFLCLSKCNVYMTTKPVYKYYINPNGAMRSISTCFNVKYLTNLDARIECFLIVKSVTTIYDVKLRFAAICSVCKIYLNIIDLISKYKVSERKILEQIERKIQYNTSWGFLFLCHSYVFFIKIVRKLCKIIKK